MDESDWSFALLGPLEVRRRGELVAVPAQRQRILLATLLLSNGTTVVVDDLIDRIWSSEAPRNAVASVQSLVMRLRRTLAPELVETRVHGYAMDVPPDSVDLHRCSALWQRAQRAEPIERAALLREAFGLWRGEPLTDVTSDVLHREDAPALQERWAQLSEDYFDAELVAGRHREIVAALREATGRHRYREGVWAKLMVALHRSGQQADALAAYRDARNLLRTDLGLDPGPQLQALHQSILLGDPVEAPILVTEGPDLDVEVPGGDDADAGWLGQFRLPPDASPLIGRDKDVAALMDLLRPSDSAVPLAAITGPPGAGKSALAVHVAHRLVEHYPDGQWHLALDGAGARPRPTGELLDELLRTAGVAPAAIPVGDDERAGLLRSRLAGRRILLLLDNAANAAQILPLLPGAPGSAVLVTSRSGLSGLAVASNARRHPLGMLDTCEGVELLIQLLDPHRVEAEQQAAAELVKLCGGLPLALRIVGANLAFRPHATLADYAADLRGDDRLRGLAVPGDPQVAVRTAFDLSYASLPDAERRAFRLLGLLPGSDLSVSAASALFGEPAGVLLDSLAGAHLIESFATSRYAMHDLLRIYAAERARSDEPQALAQAAVRRLLDWYRHTAYAATTLFDPGYSRPASPTPPDVRPLSFPDADAAMDWCEQERRNVVAAIRHAADIGDSQQAWQLFEAIRTDLLHRQRTDDWQEAVSAALRVAKATGDVRAAADLHFNQGTLNWARGEFPEAARELDIALTFGREQEDPTLAIRALNNLGLVRLELGELDAAAGCLAEAVALGEGSLSGMHRGSILNNLGIAHLERGNLKQAREAFLTSLAANREAQSVRGAGIAENNLGTVARALGDLVEATAHFETALDVARRVDARSEEVNALVGLASVHRDAGRTSQATQYAQTALATARAAGHRRSEMDALIELGAARLATGEALLALGTYEIAWRGAVELGYRRAEIEALTGLALAGHLAGDGDDHVARAEEALALADSAGMRLLQAQATTALAGILAGSCRSEEADTQVARATALFEACGCPAGIAAAHSG